MQLSFYFFTQPATTHIYAYAHSLSRHDAHPILVCPTQLLSLLNSLQRGFGTLVIEQRSSELWQLLSAVKAEFGKCAGVLEKAHGQLDTVQNSIKAAGVRTRAIERQLKGVETLPGADAQKLLDADGE